MRRTQHQSINPRLILQRELERRCQSNPRYSLRAFAKAMGMSPAALSLVLNSKRQLSKKAVRRIADILPLSPEESSALCEWGKDLSGASNIHQMSVDSFSFISDWYHYGILSLLEIPGARFEAKWISGRLGITEIEAKAAMERLVRLGVLECRDGRWRQAVGPIRIGNDIPTAATKKFQRQLLQKAIESIDNDPGEVRDFSSMTFAMDPELVPYARQEIRKFRRKLAEKLEARGNPKRVYEFTVQIFPVSRSFKMEKSK